MALPPFKVRITGDSLGSLSSCYYCSASVMLFYMQLLTPLTQKLTGRISPYIGNLGFLMSLNLENNSFIQQITSELGRLRRLKYLLLQNNSVSGEILATTSDCTEFVQTRVSFTKARRNISSGNWCFLTETRILHS